MITCTISFFLALALASMITPLVRDFAARRRLVDEAKSSRKVHSQPIPRLGGLAIVAAFYAPLIGLLIVDSGVGSFFLADPRHAVGIFVGGLFIAIVGIVDDTRGIGAAKKFSAQFLVAATMFALGFEVERLWTPWGAVELGVLALPFTMVWIVGIINAMNLMDGLDGLASGIAFLAVGTNFVIAAVNGNVVMMLYMAALGGAILGFLIYNFNPASVFMGDTGSMFLGFVLATTTIITNTKSSAAVAMLAPILALGLPIMDTLLAMVRRGLRGQALFAADKEHIHHKLLAMGYSQRRAVLTLYGLAVVFALLGLGSAFANGRQTASILLVTGTVSFIVMRKLGYFRVMSQNLPDERRRNLALRDQMNEIANSVRAAECASEAWRAVEPIRGALGLAELSLRLVLRPKSGAGETSRFGWSLDAGAVNGMELNYALRAGAVNYGELRVGWRDGRTTIDRDDEIALEKLTLELAGAAKRLSAKPSEQLAVPLQKAG